MIRLPTTMIGAAGRTKTVTVSPTPIARPALSSPITAPRPPRRHHPAEAAEPVVDPGRSGGVGHDALCPRSQVTSGIALKTEEGRGLSYRFKPGRSTPNLPAGSGTAPSDCRRSGDRVRRAGSGRPSSCVGRTRRGAQLRRTRRRSRPTMPSCRRAVAGVAPADMISGDQPAHRQRRHRGDRHRANRHRADRQRDRPVAGWPVDYPRDLHVAQPARLPWIAMRSPG